MKYFILAISLLFIPSMTAQEDADYSAEQKQLEAIINSLNYQSGKIQIKDGLAQLNTGDNFLFLGPEDTNKVLTDLWQNPPADYLGLIVPKGFEPFGDQNNWAITIDYTEEGYIEDDDASDIDYDDLLQGMKESTLAVNPERKKLGYGKIELLGWASKPYYDQSAHVLHWAKEIQFDEGEAASISLNYNIRVLGRRGVLNLNIIAGMEQLQELKGHVPQLLTAIQYNEGNRYQDFNSATDNVAAYGIGALVAGKVFAKAGIFKGLIGILLAFKKFIFIGAIGLFALVRKMMGGKEN